MSKRTPPAPSENTTAIRYARLNRSVAFGTASDDVSFLVKLTAQLGDLATRATAYLDLAARGLRDPSSEDRIATSAVCAESANWITRQSGYYGPWIKRSEAVPTNEPNRHVDVMFCSPGDRIPRHGAYVTDAAGHGTWDVYSALQDYLLSYTGPEPSLWCFALSVPSAVDEANIEPMLDRTLDPNIDRLRAALEADLADNTTRLSADALLALPSLKRIIRELTQVQNAHLRTAEALGVPANAHEPARMAQSLMRLRNATAPVKNSGGDPERSDR